MIISKRFYLVDLITFLILHLFVIRVEWFVYFDYFKYLCIVFSGLYVAMNINIILRNRQYLIFNILIIILSVFILGSSFINKGLIISRDPFLAGIVFVVSLIISVLFIEIAMCKNMLRRIIFDILIVLGAYLLINNTLILLFGEDIKRNGQFLLGNKFVVSYLNIIFVILFWFYKLYFSRIYSQRIKLLVLSFISMLIAILVKCSTGIVGNLFLILFVILEKKINKLGDKKILFSSILILSICFVYIYRNILDISIVKWFIQTVLNRDLSLTARTYIYTKINYLIEDKILFGYGYGSSYDICTYYIGAPNLQNGFFNFLLENGIFSSLIYCLILLYPVYLKKEKSKLIYPLYVYLFIFIFLSSIEITFNATLIFIVCLIVVLNNKKVYWRSNNE